METRSTDNFVQLELQQDPCYRFSSVALPLGAVLAVLLAPLLCLLHSFPVASVLAPVSLFVGVSYYCLWRYALPAVRSRMQLDLVAGSYLLIALLAQAIVTFRQGTEHSLAHASIIMACALAFTSHAIYFITIAIGLTLCLAVQSFAGVALSSTQLFYLCFVVPCAALIVRISLAYAVRQLEQSRMQSERSLGKLSESEKKLQSVEEKRRETESRLQAYHSQKMESLGLLARGIAHDFNNYLLAIVAVSESIQSDHPTGPTAEHAKQIETAALNAAEVCKEMLTFTGKSQLKKDYTDPNKLLCELEPLIKAAMPKNVELHFQSADESLTVLVDASQIKQAIINLVTNAAEATQPEGGIVTVSCTPFKATKEDSRSDAFVVGDRLGVGEYIAFAVSDNGEGMDDATQSQAFDPYFTTRPDGHGFGLSVTAGIVKGHGGAIRCASRPGAGTTMTLIFPRVQRPGRVESPARANLVDELGSILVVDDEPIVLDSVSRMLASVGWSVSKAENGEQAIELLSNRAQDFIAVVMDYSMPGMNGLQVVKQMRESQLNTPVVLCSGFMDPANGDVGVSPDAFIKKPYRLESLQSAIATALIGQHAEAFEESDS